MSNSARNWFYRFALERGYLDALLDEYIVRPFIGVFNWCNRKEQKGVRFLSASKPKVMTEAAAVDNLGQFEGDNNPDDPDDDLVANSGDQTESALGGQKEMK